MSQIVRQTPPLSQRLEEVITFARKQTGSDLDQTLARAQDLGLKVFVCSALTDIDEPSDLVQLPKDLYPKFDLGDW